ncbi:MAG: iron-sulfur cluster insertion protein ErpA [Gemmatimonadota bacterium]
MTHTAETHSATRSDEALVSLTELAAEKVREFLAGEELPDGGLRVSVLPGGCSGFEYGLEIEETVREDDIVLTSRGVRLIVDPFSAQYLAGVSIDYHTSFQGSGFTFDNPNSTGSCGCGSSFAV